MTTHTDKSEMETHERLKHRASDLIHDVTDEMTYEATQIHATGAPCNPTHSDHVVRRHVFGLSVGFFVAIVAFLVLVIAGFLIFGRH